MMLITFEEPDHLRHWPPFGRAAQIESASFRHPKFPGPYPGFRRLQNIQPYCSFGLAPGGSGTARVLTRVLNSRVQNPEGTIAVGVL